MTAASIHPAYPTHRLRPARSTSPPRTRKLKKSDDPPHHHPTHRKLGFPINIFRRHAHPSEEFAHLQHAFPSRPHPRDEIVNITYEARLRTTSSPTPLSPASDDDEKPVLPHLDVPRMSLDISFSRTPSPEPHQYRTRAVKVETRERVDMMFPSASAHHTIHTSMEYDAAQRPADLHSAMKPLSLPFTSQAAHALVSSSSSASGHPISIPGIRAKPAKLRPLPPIPTTPFAPIPFSSNSAYRKHASSQQASPTDMSGIDTGMSVAPKEKEAGHAPRRLPLPPVPCQPERTESQPLPSTSSRPQPAAPSASEPLLPVATRPSPDDDGERSDGSSLTPDLICSSLPSSKSTSSSSLHNLVEPPPRPRRSSKRPQPESQPRRRGGPREGDIPAVPWSPPECWSGPSSRAVSPAPEQRGLFSQAKSPSVKSQPKGKGRQLFALADASAISLHTDSGSSVYSAESMQRSVYPSPTPSRVLSRQGSGTFYEKSAHPSVGVQEALASKLKHLQALKPN
ncbi:hypothetical protein HWV62_14544 [Athelia sp. TMB]|nr:hypothetical protein HWV62_14544 [Athelia sp. TMB]